MRALGEFEQLILWAILRLGEDAYGVQIGREIEERSGRPVSPGALYTALGRLEDRSMVSSQEEQGDPTRGGRPRRFYALEAAAAKALADSRARLNAMAEGMTEALEQVAEGQPR